MVIIVVFCITTMASAYRESQKARAEYCNLEASLDCYHDVSVQATEYPELHKNVIEAMRDDMLTNGEYDELQKSLANYKSIRARRKLVDSCLINLD